MTAAPHNPPIERPCTKCGETKSLDDFHLCKTGPHGRAYSCKACFLRYYEETKAERKARKAADREATRQAKAAARARLAKLEERA